MTIQDLTSSRSTITSFSNKRIEREKIASMLEASRWISSPDRLQSIELIIVDDPNIIEKMVKELNLPEAIVYVSICTNNKLATSKYKNQANSILDLEVGAIIQTMQLVAQEEGLGTRWMFTSEETLKEILGIPEGYGTKNILLVGYPNRKTRVQPSPYDVTDITFLNKHGKKFKPFYEGRDWQGLQHYKKELLGKKGLKK